MSQPAGPRARVFLRIRDAYLQVAVGSVLRDSGFIPIDADDGEAFLITDDAHLQGARSILIVEETSAASKAAVEALMKRRVCAVISRDEPDQLPLVLEALPRGLITVPRSVLELATTSPSLDDRQMQVLELVTAGLSNGRIAQRLHVSEATVKREVSALLRSFSCSSRLELVTKTAAVGYAPTRI